MIWHIWEAFLNWIGIATATETQRCEERSAEMIGKIALIESTQQNIVEIIRGFDGSAERSSAERSVAKSVVETGGKLALIESTQKDIIGKLHEAEDERGKALAKVDRLVGMVEHLGGRLIAAESRADLLHKRMSDAEVRLENPIMTVSYPPSRPIILPPDPAKDATIRAAAMKNVRVGPGLVMKEEWNSFAKDLKNQQEPSKVTYRGQEIGEVVPGSQKIDEKGNLSVDFKINVPTEVLAEVVSMVETNIRFRKNSLYYTAYLDWDDSHNLRSLATPYFVKDGCGDIKGMSVTSFGVNESHHYQRRNGYIGFNEFGGGSGFRVAISEAACCAIRDALKYLSQA